jgi:uncharacterized protein YcbX
MMQIKPTQNTTPPEMTEPLSPQLKGLYRYPIKGLTPERLEQVSLTARETLPFDRAYAIENGPGRFDPDAPRHLPKINFMMLMRDERLATLRSQFDDATETLTIFRDGKQVARGQLTSRIGRQLIEQFMASYMKAELRGPPRIVHAPGHSFSDVAAKCVHIVNLASVREFERMQGTAGRSAALPRQPVYRRGGAVGGVRLARQAAASRPAELAVFARTQRCEATNVDPATGARDMAIPAWLQRSVGHSDFASTPRSSGAES